MLVGVDVGGTFTDIVGVDNEGRISTAKAASTPDDQSVGVLNAVEALAEERGTSAADLLADVTLFIHGTTVATNILVERKGARVGLLTTDGFRDLLELREGTKSDRYNLRSPFPQPLVPRPLRIEVPERVRWNGVVEAELEDGAVVKALRALRNDGVEALTVCFLHAHRNPAHELRIREFLVAAGWSPYLSLAHEVLGRAGEYDRLSTATVNSYIGPGLARYLDKLAGRLTQVGLRVPVMVMQSTGGVLPIQQAIAHAVGAVASGPAGGAMAAAMFARANQAAHLVSYDMGGTSTDICVVEKGMPLERQYTRFDDIKVASSALDISIMGAGGGSIARIDKGGILTLGPDSAGAQPGPACYGRGGTTPTLTDANVVLGLISPVSFLGGKMKLYRELAAEAINAQIAVPLKLSVEDASLAIVALANTLVAEGIRASTVRRGLDPRDVALLPCGGAGGLHADAIARELMISKIIVPRHASMFSALGFLSSDIRHDFTAPVGLRIDALMPGDLPGILLPLEEKGRHLLADEGFSEANVEVRYFLDCRYHRQIFSVEVPLGPADLDLPDSGWLGRRFEDAYSALYQHVHTDVPGYIESCRVAVTGRLPRLILPEQANAGSDASPARIGSRPVYFERWVETPVYQFDSLKHGMRFEGPAIVESWSTSVLVEAGTSATVDTTGNLILQPRSPS
jgi:N-methylhydantoinase A